MEIEWRQRHRAGYARDGRHALARFAGGERDGYFLRRALELLRSYTESPLAQITDLQTDEVMVRLAIELYHQLHNLGFYPQIAALWPLLAILAQRLPDPAPYAELVKQRAIALSVQGANEQVKALYGALTGSAIFARLSLRMQTDILTSAATWQVWAGDLHEGERLLQRCLTLTEPYLHLKTHTLTDANGRRSATYSIPLWEARAYALNQLGAVAFFRGEFEQAAKHYHACRQVFLAHGEAENLACVADQSQGRLLLHWRRADDGIPVLAHGLAIRRRRQEAEAVALNLLYLAAAHLECQQLGVAEPLLNEAMQDCRALEHGYGAVLCHLYFGQLALIQGDVQATVAQWRQVLALLRTVEMPLVELRILVCYLPCLLYKGQWRLFVAASRQLIRSIRRQRLGPVTVWRLAWRFGLRM
ncbi:MAG: hypothetical protein KJZ93_23575 [Caldilineaceae bacterium]|nr:hypothetical protein [Caldilineaceae bacterium]